MTATPIDPAAVPGSDLRPDEVSLQAICIRSVGANVAVAGGRVVQAWTGLGPHYEAPESVLLLGVMGPVRVNADDCEGACGAVADALNTYAIVMASVKSELGLVRRGASELRAAVAAMDSNLAKVLGSVGVTWPRRRGPTP